MLFIYIDFNDDDNLRILEFFGLKPEDCPTLRLIELEEDLVKYRPPTLDLSVAGIQQFVQDFLDGKLTVRIIDAVFLHVGNCLLCVRVSRVMIHGTLKMFLFFLLFCSSSFKNTGQA